MDYFAEAGNLFVVNDEGNICWTGLPEQYPVVWAARIPGTNDALVLYDFYIPRDQHSGYTNLVRIDSSLHVLWRAESPSNRDVYLGAWFVGEEIEANSFNSYRVVIDPQTGHIKKAAFTK